jgi:glycine/D-amino acid oxidase-like deaminating enzyme
MPVVIVGAGINGTLSAYYLARKGAKVTVLERNGAVASEASGANASQLSFSSLYPIGNPSLIPTIPSRPRARIREPPAEGSATRRSRRRRATGDRSEIR